MLGLVEAARRFDPDRGVRLAAYAAWWIRAYMRQVHDFQSPHRAYALFTHGRKLLANLARTQREITQTTGERPDAEAVAEMLGVGVRDVEEMEAALSGRDIPSVSTPKAGRWGSFRGAFAGGRSWPRPKSASGRCARYVARCRASRSASAASCRRRYLTEETTSLASIVAAWVCRASAYASSNTRHRRRCGTRSAPPYRRIGLNSQ